MLKKIGFIASMTLGLILLAALISFVISEFYPAIDNKIALLFSSNWLLTIFKIHAGLISDNPNPLFGINLYDILILILLFIVCSSLFTISQKKNRIWLVISMTLLFLGIIIFSLTQLAGRSAFMASGIFISISLIRVQIKTAGLIGIVSNLLLLLGDFTVGPHISFFAPLFLFGYILLTKSFAPSGRASSTACGTSNKLMTRLRR
jgi:hypothetical protein